MSKGKAAHLLSEPAAGAPNSGPPRPTGTPTSPGPDRIRLVRLEQSNWKGDGLELVAFALLRKRRKSSSNKWSGGARRSSTENGCSILPNAWRR